MKFGPNLQNFEIGYKSDYSQLITICVQKVNFTGESGTRLD